MLVVPSETTNSLFANYDPLPTTFDELMGPEATARPEFRRVVELLGAMRKDEFSRAQALAELSLLNQGVTFSVYSDQRGTEKSSRSASCRAWSPRPPSRTSRGG